MTRVLERSGLADYSHVPEDKREAILHRGQAVHEAMALIAREKIDGRPHFDRAYLDQVPEYAPYILSGEAWLKDSGFRPLLVEALVCEPDFGLAGIIDLAGLLPDGTPAVVDWKCNDVLKVAGVQMAGYCWMIAHINRIHGHAGRPLHKYPHAAASHVRIAVALRADGPARPHFFSDIQDSMNFLSALSAVRASERLNG
jgi:hypothetical protein